MSEPHVLPTTDSGYKIDEEFMIKEVFLLVWPIHLPPTSYCNLLIMTADNVDVILLQVEDTIFTTNRRPLLDDSEYFREKLSEGSKEGQSVQGSSADHPLRLDGVKKEDMRVFLRALNPR